MVVSWWYPSLNVASRIKCIPGVSEMMTYWPEYGAASSSAFLRASMRFTNGSSSVPSLFWSDLPSLITDYRFVTNSSRGSESAWALLEHSPVRDKGSKEEEVAIVAGWALLAWRANAWSASQMAWLALAWREVVEASFRAEVDALRLHCNQPIYTSRTKWHLVLCHCNLLVANSFEAIDTHGFKSIWSAFWE